MYSPSQFEADGAQDVLSKGKCRAGKASRTRTVDAGLVRVG